MTRPDMSLLAGNSPRPPRPRRYVSPALLKALRPTFRHSQSRDAYVLRLIGNRFGPVLRPDYSRHGRRD
jgi:hypothetical protein